MSKRKHKSDVETMMVCDGKDLFIERGGVRIAKRGHPGTPQARTWISLEPGFSVRDTPNYKGIVVEFKPETAVRQ